MLRFARALPWIAVLVAAGSAQVPPIFDTPLLKTSGAASDVALLDVDGDLRDELLAVQGAAGVQLFRRAPDGTWLAPQSVDTGGAAARVAVGDLDGDGRGDAVFVGASNGLLAVLLADGAGGLAPPQLQSPGGQTSDLALGDLDGNGALDAAVTDRIAGHVRVLLNDGAGGLQAAGDHATKPAPDAIALGDTNGDGDLDVLTAHLLAKIVARLGGDGQGGLGVLRPYASGGFVSAIDCGDVDGDGFDDVLGGSVGPKALVVLRGTAAGLAAPSITPTSVEVDDVVARDVNGDGLADAFALENGAAGSFFAIAHAAGGGALGAPHEYLTSTSALHLAVGDVDGDGAADGVSTNSSFWLLAVRRGDGAGGLAEPPTASVGGGPVDVCVADIDGDGFADFVTNGVPGVAVVRTDGAGGLLAPALVGLDEDSTDVQAADVDADGDTDVVALQGFDQVQLTVLRNAGGVLTGGTPVTLFPLDAAGELELADLDGDGAPDAIAGSGWDFGGGHVLVARGTGSGGWVLPPASFLGGNYAFADVGSADLDLDGDLDVITLGLDVNFLTDFRLWRLINDGTGGLSVLPSQFASNTNWEALPDNLTAGDADDDGDADVVVLTGSAYYFSGDGTGTLVAQGMLDTTGKPADAAFADVDRDGRTDVLVTSFQGPSLSVVRGLGGGAFGADLVWLGAESGRELGVVDANDDGWPDVGVAGPFDGTLVLHVNELQVGLAAVTPAAGNLQGGQLVTLSLQPASLLLPAPQVSFGDVPATVVGSGPGFVQVHAPAVTEAPGGAVDVHISSVLGSVLRGAAWTWTPSLQAGVSGSVAGGGSVHVAWAGDPAAGPQLVVLWLGHPLVPPVNLTLPAWGGVFHVQPFLFLLAGAPASLSPLQLGFPPLPASVAGVPLSLQAALTGEGGSKGSFSNVAEFAIP